MPRIVSSSTSLRVLVTGSSGFLGRAITAELRQESARRNLPIHLRLFDQRHPSIPVAPTDEIISGNILDKSALSAATKGVDAVIHSAAMIGWGPIGPPALQLVNVEGTRNVVDACVEQGVSVLAYTSSIDVIREAFVPVFNFDGASVAYPAQPCTPYGATKREGEQLILAADGTKSQSKSSGSLRTFALRCTPIYGEADPLMIPPLLRILRNKQRYLRLGTPEAVAQYGYVGNLAHGHAHSVLSAAMGDITLDKVGGKPFMIVDGPPRYYYDVVEPIVQDLGYMIPEDRLPNAVAWGIAKATDLAIMAVNVVKEYNPALVLTQAALDHMVVPRTYDGSALEREFGWKRKYTYDEARKRTVEWFKANPQVWQ
ncbi:NAD(P)-binding protein [Gonapodya prolifera JEL478]|uniref:NAD(P)-binding protein n=1 Tax=Gonapodya prolifera (strain JEL478) TaxID=1344416 RepID=A0A139ASU3_GONPJ|nr:NAD(P)-binding protein [Gonapodya prolifera JEL478]|eukprot:KXS19565.1 NAD(P)-binding protein [Gonapodya prolifera JEL478]